MNALKVGYIRDPCTVLVSWSLYRIYKSSGILADGTAQLIRSVSRPSPQQFNRSHPRSAPWPDFSHNTWVPWIHSRISLDSQKMSGSGSSLSEEQMRGRPPFFRGYVTPRTVRKSTELVNGEIASGYVLPPSVSFHLSIAPGSTRPLDGG
jgi:hypothetical protein